MTIDLLYNFHMFEKSFFTSEAATLHYEGHYLQYVRKLKELGYEDADLHELIKQHRSGQVYNNACQVLNHEFFDESTRNPQSNQELKRTLDERFNFTEQFATSALSLFGSGWTWLTYRDDGELTILNTTNADRPDASHCPLLVLDLWEHSFYVDFPAQKAKYIMSFLERGINWDFLRMNMERASKS